MRKSNLTAVQNMTLRNGVLCLLPVICSIILRPLNLFNELDMKFLMRIALVGIAAYGVYAQYRKKLDAQKIVFLILIAGCVLRIGYTMYTHAFTRGHDIGMNNPEGVGHWGYIYHIINGHLPPSNEYQFYQPPLYYIISAVFIRIMMAVKGMEEWGGLEYIPQLISCVCSIVVMLTTVKIMDGLKIEKKWQIIPAALVAVYPAQIMAAGRMNNDSMVQMFMILSLYATLRWHQERSIKNIIFIALAIGFGMMTKINCGIIAFVTGPVMIYHFVRAVKSKDSNLIKSMIAQFAVFAVICFPLGLWYGIRNYIAFDQPLTFVHELPKGTAIDTSGDSFVDRWIYFPLFHFKDAPYVNMGDDCNTWMILIKSGMHGEFNWDNTSKFLAWTIDYVHIILMLITVFAMIFSLAKDKSLDKISKYSALWVWVIVAISYIQFNISYPYSCTPNFRYVMPAQIASSFFLAYACRYFYANINNKNYKYLFKGFICIISLFCVMSLMHFC